MNIPIWQFVWLYWCANLYSESGVIFLHDLLDAKYASAFAEGVIVSDRNPPTGAEKVWASALRLKHRIEAQLTCYICTVHTQRAGPSDQRLEPNRDPGHRGMILRSVAVNTVIGNAD